jgi:hypothetical protein
MSHAPEHRDDGNSDPPLWQQYRKTLVVLIIGLIAALTDLGVALEGGMTGQERVHVVIVFLSTLLSAGGAAAVGNSYTQAQLQAKLAEASRR